MSNETNTQVQAPRWRISLDAWAVTTAFILALAVRAGLLKHIPW